MKEERAEILDLGLDVLVALATYNEIDNLPHLLPAILEALPNAGVLIIDDASPDGTGKWCDELMDREPRVEVMHRSGKLGLGTAYWAAMEFARLHDFDWLITMDADGSHDPLALPLLLARAHALPPCDVVIGSRYVQGGSIRDWPWRRRLASSWLNGLLRRAIGGGIRDYTSGYRCYRVALLEGDVVSIPKATGFGFLEEIVMKLLQHGAIFAEVPIEFRDRRKGKSKATWRESWTSATGIIRLLAGRTDQPLSHPAPQDE